MVQGQRDVELVFVWDLVTIQDSFHGPTQCPNEGVGQTVLGDQIPLLHGAESDHALVDSKASALSFVEGFGHKS